MKKTLMISGLICFAMIASTAADRIPSLKKAIANDQILAQSGILVGKIRDQKDGESVPFASVQLFRDGKKGFKTASDIDGKYKMENIPCGEYTLKVKAVGYDSLTISDVTINANRKLTMNLEVSPKSARYY